MKRSIQGKVAGPAHVVPLSRQAVDILEELHALTGRGRLLFPGLRSRERPISDMTMNAALRRLGFTGNDEMTSHGWRAMARTLICRAAGHCSGRDRSPAGPRRAAMPWGGPTTAPQFLQQRRALMQAWADYLDRLRQGAEVLPLRAGAGR
jgi:integrase